MIDIYCFLYQYLHYIDLTKLIFEIIGTKKSAAITIRTTVSIFNLYFCILFFLCILFRLVGIHWTPQERWRVVVKTSTGRLNYFLHARLLPEKYWLFWPVRPATIFLIFCTLLLGRQLLFRSLEENSSYKLSY